MEYAGLVAPAVRVLKVLYDTADKHTVIKIELKLGINKLKCDLEVIAEDIQKHEEQKLQELAYEIEDFLPDILIPGAIEFILTALRLERGSKQIAIIKYFQEKMDQIVKRRNETKESSKDVPRGWWKMSHHAELVGKAKSELVKLLSAADGQLRVVSIVGCTGLGKTALAWALFHDPNVAKEFPCKAFVVASEYTDDEAGDAVPKMTKEERDEKKPKEFLKKILKEVRRHDMPPAASSEDSSNLAQLTQELQALLATQRYLVVVDDIKEVEMYTFLKTVFPNDKISDSRIIVTTSIQSVANSFSRGSYRYTMRGLSAKDSRTLFSREIYGTESINQAIVNSSESIFSKCDGSPLALLRVANSLKPNLDPDNCRNVGNALGTYVAGATEGSALWDLKKALFECYGSLPEYHDRRRLLSVVMCLQGHGINRNSLLRKWIAEGLVAIEGQNNENDVASTSFRGFVDRSIIDPRVSGSNTKVKRYQLQGVLLEFIVHKSTCAKNFVTLIRPDDRLPREKDDNNRIHRLFVSDGIEGSMIEEIETDLGFVRWLTICSTSSSIPIKLTKCKLLRVLDLEGCKGIDGNVLANICELVKSLKYLSLRGSDVKKIPDNITLLVNLETLDIRETEVNNLAIEVLMMPGLAHLFGQFELVGSHQEVVDTLKKKKGHLETLSGVIIHKEKEGFKEIMLHAKKLKKVKIWCKGSTSAEDIFPSEKFSGSKCLESLSVDSSDQPKGLLNNEFLESFSGDLAIRSLKLRGALEGLPVITSNNFMKLKKVGELQLSSTGLSWKTLSVLQKMSELLNLKITENRHESGDESFIVEEGGFPSLERLSIVAPKLPKVQLKKGATQCLVSLELLLCSVTTLQNHVTAEISSPLPEPLSQIGAASEITKRSFFGRVKRTLNKSAVDVGICICLPCTRPHVQTRATSEIISDQPEQTAAEAEATSEIISHQPDQTAVEVGVTSEISTRHPDQAAVKIGATSQNTTHQPEAAAPAESVADIELHLGVEGLLHLEKLNEVILYHDSDNKKMQYWEKLAKMHINRPYVKKSNHDQTATQQPAHVT